MKKFKKLISIMLVAVMALAMSVTAFAAEPEQKKVTIKNPVAGHTYTAYQILQGTKAEDGKLHGLNWGSGITEAGKAALKTQLGLGGGATVAQVADKLSKVTSDSEAMDAIAQILGDAKAGNGTVLTPVEGGSVSATVAQGYYVIIDALTDDAAADSTISKYMVGVVGDVDINVKSQTTTSQKTVKDKEDAYKQFTEANIGEARTFYLAAQLPADYSAYSAFYMNFRDVMNQMDFDSLTSVTVKRNLETKDGKWDPTTGDVVATLNEQSGSDKVNGYELSTSDNASVNGTNLNVKILDLKQIASDAVAGDYVVVEYVAKLNSNAVVNAANENKFDLEFSRDPNSNWRPKTPNTPAPPVGVTPEDHADVYTTELELTKIDGTTHDILTGAEFTLTGETTDVVIKTSTEFVEDAEGEYYKLKNDTYTKTAPTDDTKDLYESTTKKYSVTTETKVVGASTTEKDIKSFVGKDGKLTFTGLGEGTYKLEETEVPDGYNKMTDKEFTISFDRTTKTFKVTGDLERLASEIENLSGSLLPETGGIGTTIFYIVGAILVIGAGVILVAKKRMSHE